MDRVRRKDKISNTDRSSGRRVGLGVREVEVLYHVVNHVVKQLYFKKIRKNPAYRFQLNIKDLTISPHRPLLSFPLSSPLFLSPLETSARQTRSLVRK
jgi:hypothetical protein